MHDYKITAMNTQEKYPEWNKNNRVSNNQFVTTDSYRDHFLKT